MSAKKRISRGKSTAASPTVTDDFFDEKTSRMFYYFDRAWEARKAKFYADADLLAISTGVNPADHESVRNYLKRAMLDYSEALHANAPEEIDGKRDLLPQTDWRIIHARRDRNEVAAAMLYREAAAEIREMRYCDERAEAALAAKPKRGRPKSKEGRQEWTPTPEKRLAAIVIMERVRQRKNDSVRQAATYCANHPEIEPKPTTAPGDGGADYRAFKADAAFGRWAKFNGTTATCLKSLLPEEWETTKATLR